jgi:hypothetical protein
VLSEDHVNDFPVEADVSFRPLRFFLGKLVDRGSENVLELERTSREQLAREQLQRRKRKKE